jgi:hypothetical protein
MVRETRSPSQGSDATPTIPEKSEQNVEGESSDQVKFIVDQRRDSKTSDPKKFGRTIEGSEFVHKEEEDEE